MESQQPAIELTNVSYAYNGVSVLAGVDLRLEQGEYLAVLGPNGGGKTTLLRAILGLGTPTDGTVRVLGTDPKSARPRIGYLQQHAHETRDFPITVLDTVLMGRIGIRGFSRPGPRDREVAEQCLAHVGMEPFAARRIGELSGGQRQRVFIARALAARPQLLLLDEPVSSIDQEGRNTLFDFLARLHKEGMTIVMVSHDISVVSRSVTSVACVNKTLYHHHTPEITYDMVKMLWGCEDGNCPVDLIAHGLPHRVLAEHDHMGLEQEGRAHAHAASPEKDHV